MLGPVVCHLYIERLSISSSSEFYTNSFFLFIFSKGPMGITTKYTNKSDTGRIKSEKGL